MVRAVASVAGTTALRPIAFALRPKAVFGRRVGRRAEFVVRVPSVPHAAITFTRLDKWPAVRKGRRPQPRRLALHALALEIERHGSADQILQGRLIDLVAFVEVDGAPDIPFEAGVEEAFRVLKRSPPGEGQPHVV